MRENGLLRSFGDHFVGVRRKHGEDFGPIYGRKMRATGADGNLAFARRAAGAQNFDDFRAERFHWLPAASPFGLALLYRRRRARRWAASLCRSTPATPRKNRRQ